MRAARKIEHSRCELGCWTIAALASLLLAGCAGDRLPAAGPAEFASESLQVEHEVRFAEGRKTLSQIDLERLSRFLADADPTGDGDIVVRVGPGQTERLIHLRALLLSEGRRASGGVDPNQPEDRAVLSIEQDLALPTRCAGEGLWDSDIAEDSEGLPIGCTTSMNLQAMIDDPEDIARGRRLGPAAASPAVDLARDYLSRFADRPVDIPGDGEMGPIPGAADAPDTGASPHALPDPTQGQ